MACSFNSAVYSCFGILFTFRPSGINANHRPLEDEKRRAAHLNAHLRPVLGWRRYVFILRLFASAGRYKKAFARPQDDASLRGVKQTFLLVGALYNELAREAGPQQALDTTQAFLYDLGCSVQRKAYFVGAT